MSENKTFEYNFGDIYSMYIQKALRKDRTKQEVTEVISWLTGYKETEIIDITKKEITLKEFFINAPNLNPNAKLIRGSVCGVEVQEIEDPIVRQIRYMDKLVDELAKGKPMVKILRK